MSCFASNFDYLCMLLEIVVENGTQAVGQEEEEEDEDEAGDADDDYDDGDSESEDDDDDMEIGWKQDQAPLNSGNDERQSKSLVRSWIEEDDDVSDS